MEFIFGVMAANMMANGRMVNSMERERTLIQVAKPNKELGKMDQLQNGSIYQVVKSKYKIYELNNLKLLNNLE